MSYGRNHAAFRFIRKIWNCEKIICFYSTPRLWYYIIYCVFTTVIMVDVVFARSLKVIRNSIENDWTNVYAYYVCRYLYSCGYPVMQFFNHRSIYDEINLNPSNISLLIIFSKLILKVWDVFATFVLIAFSKLCNNFQKRTSLWKFTIL